MLDLERRRILLVDYDNDLLTRLAVLLTDEKHNVTAAWGGREANYLLASKKFDLVLLSSHLPDTNARELWHLLRKVPSSAEIALIKGGNPMTEDLRALLRDCEAHCVIPRTTPIQISSAVDHCLSSRQFHMPGLHDRTTN